MIDWINRISNAVGGSLLGPFEEASPWLALSAAALLMAVLALLAYKFCSNQAALTRRRDQALARLLELQLFKDDLLSIFGASGRILAAVGLYLAESLKPLVVLIIPLGLLFIQLAGWFESRPLKPGEAALLTVRLAAAAPDGIALTAKASDGIDLEAGPFVSAPDREVVWRVRPRAATNGWVAVTIDGVELRKSVTATDRRMPRISPERVRGGVGARLLHPFEPGLPAGTPVTAIGVDYPVRKLNLGSHRVDWIVALFVLSLAFGLALKRPMRVEF